MDCEQKGVAGMAGMAGPQLKLMILAVQLEVGAGGRLRELIEQCWTQMLSSEREIQLPGSDCSDRW